MTFTPGPFETHLTFAPLMAEQADRARSWAAKWHCKFLQIELDRGSTPTQPMLTWHSRGTLQEQRNFAEERANILQQAGLPITRIKLEVAANHYGVPILDFGAEDHRYFEYHVKLLLNGDADEAVLREIAETHGARLSRNAYKRRDDGQHERFVTLRCHSMGSVTANARFRLLNDALHQTGHPILDREEEYVVYDSDMSVDAGWLDSEEVLQ